MCLGSPRPLEPINVVAIRTGHTSQHASVLRDTAMALSGNILARSDFPFEMTFSVFQAESGLMGHTLRGAPQHECSLPSQNRNLKCAMLMRAVYQTWHVYCLQRIRNAITQ